MIEWEYTWLESTLQHPKGSLNVFRSTLLPSQKNPFFLGNGWVDGSDKPAVLWVGTINQQKSLMKRLVFSRDVVGDNTSLLLHFEITSI
jgi:hypothetical protein